MRHTDYAATAYMSNHWSGGEEERSGKEAGHGRRGRRGKEGGVGKEGRRAGLREGRKEGKEP
jgi:hypothetical protein